MTPQETFVTRLRRHRQRHRIAIEQIAADTRVKPELLEAFERNDLSAWPRGVYARAWIRAYATAVGLDPMDTVDEFCRLFPHGDRRVHSTIEEIAAIVAHPSEYLPEVPPDQERRRGPRAAAAAVRMPWHVAASQALASASRALRVRAAALMATAQAHTRDKRQPRTTP
jgi:hypothetical protein